MELQLIAPCLFGLEGIAGDELRRMGMENVKVEDRRVLFTGDEMEAGQVLLNAGDMDKVKIHKANMEKLVAREAEYDFVCPAHNGSTLNKRYIKDYIALDDQLLAGTAQVMPNAAGYGMGPVGMGGRKNTRVQNGGASFVYSDAWK